MPRILVHDKAREDVEEIAAYIMRDSLEAALRFCDAAEAAFSFLSLMPGAGPRIEPEIANAPNLSFWPIKRFRNYLVIYLPIESGVEIVRVIHGARDMHRVLRGRH
jgi:toxin ParE1/3/4